MAEDDDQEVFEELIRSVMPESVISNFIVVAEVVNNDDEELSIVMSDRMTPWMASGMLKFASDMIMDGHGQQSSEEE